MDMNPDKIVGTALLLGFATFGVCGFFIGRGTLPSAEAEQPPVIPQIIEFTCEEGDEITESWVGLESAKLRGMASAPNMWEITSNMGDITYFVQRPGQRCSVLTYEIEVEEPGLQS